MNFEREYEILAEKFLNDEISLEEHVEEYNRLVETESCQVDYIGWRPHEHI